jgi:hypothetical protein
MAITRSALSNKQVSSSEFLQEIYIENMVFDPKPYSRYMSADKAGNPDEKCRDHYQ